MNEKSGKGKHPSQNFSNPFFDQDLLIVVVFILVINILIFIFEFFPCVLDCSFKLKDVFAVFLIVSDLDYDCPILFIGGAKNLILDFLVLENF